MTETARTPAQSTEQDSELDPNALSAIRELMEQSEPTAAVPQAEPADDPVTPVADRRVQQRPAATPSSAKAAPIPETPKRRACDRRVPLPDLSGLTAKIAGFRPSRRMVIWGVLALFVLWRPWLVLGLIILISMFVIGVFLSIGPDTIWQWMMTRLANLRQHKPEMADRFLRRLDRFAGAWDRILDVFPEGMVDDFYMPDFNALLEAEARHADVLDRRLGAMQQG